MIHQTDAKPISIEKLLEWAFGAEKAELDQSTRRGVRIPHYLGYRSFQDALNQTAILGCRIDTSASGATFVAGESSCVHWDAETVASVVGGVLEPRTAETVHTYARAGTRPSWAPGAVPRVEPYDIQKNQHGVQPKTEPAHPSAFPGGAWRPWMEDASKSVKAAKRAPAPFTAHELANIRHLGRCTPIAYRPSQQEIDRIRGGYLVWWNALHAVREALLDGNVLKSHRLISEMPPSTPWMKEDGSPVLVETGPRPDWRNMW